MGFENGDWMCVVLYRVPAARLNLIWCNSLIINRLQLFLCGKVIRNVELLDYCCIL